jgi:hypothetical protein
MRMRKNHFRCNKQPLNAPLPATSIVLCAAEAASIQSELHGDLTGIAKLLVAAFVNDQASLGVSGPVIVLKGIAMDGQNLIALIGPVLRARNA